ncbi:ADP-ribosylation like factor [Cavenderia fasciculata]|uniref:ADP-ribosylation like factor n=1 Tax=Cavenderia fasciculata TaxID=261658 RepID=F4PLK1_CACFS|nr:ADP-ribosylation like factor [Cavenderia fasciculata]EGG23423.1 ADP-ribosylation like factor [Cavenderia fasciculata]|eukprot:XP_004361274.1 ADP-ribosylation like factor [Cavenderia fasciculata]
MGGVSSRVLKLFKQRDTKILCLGLDGAGKTTLLYKLILNEVVETIPTLGYNVETVQHKNLTFSVWDLAGQERIRATFWTPFFAKTSAIIFVVDSSDRSRIEEASTELNKLMKEDELKNIPVLVYATKQDCVDPMDVPELTDCLNLHQVKDRKWYIQPARTIEGIGIYEGLDWLANLLTDKKKHQKKSSTASDTKSPNATSPVTSPKFPSFNFNSKKTTPIKT